MLMLSPAGSVSFHGLGHFDHQRALYPLFEDITAHPVGAVNIARGVVGIGSTAACAVELCPAVRALGP